MGQQASLMIPIINKNPPINFIPQIHQFQVQYIQRLKQTPFISSSIYSSQPLIYYEPVDMSLQSLVTPRLNAMKLFPKQQIFKMIQNIFYGLNELKCHNFQHYGNISLSNIYYSKQSKTFKLINPAFNNSTNYMLAKQGKLFSFLSPQQLLDLTEQDQQIQQIPNFKTDIFIVAVCLLQVCTLRDSREIYCPETYNIFDGQVKDRLKDIEEFYSIEIAKFLELCLQYDIQKRIDLTEILKIIKNFKQGPGSNNCNEQSKTISKLQIKKGSLPFGPSHLPKKLPTTK